jgi:hypothetical protein
MNAFVYMCVACVPCSRVCRCRWCRTAAGGWRPTCGS